MNKRCTVSKNESDSLILENNENNALRALGYTVCSYKYCLGGMNLDYFGGSTNSSDICSILDLDSNEAHDFLLKSESYCNFSLPPYFCFSNMLDAIDKALSKKELTCKPQDCGNVNYRLYSNKDGRFAWRPFELIHPAIYVSLVRKITCQSSWECIKQRFAQYSGDPRLTCLSLPRVSKTKKSDTAEQIAHWWEEVEQKSLELSMEYEYLFKTDITDCYASIYTHSVAWAIHTKPIAKKKRKDFNLIGNTIDRCIQDMHDSQTNGIPQGSVLMDFVAEMVLGYADIKLLERIEKEKMQEFRILRYRDDYRIFVNNPKTGEKILKLLTEVMIDLGLKLNPGKTTCDDCVILSSIKEDKLEWLRTRRDHDNLQKQLLILHSFAQRFPNSGTLNRCLNDYHKKISMKSGFHNSVPLIAIVVDIAYHNPRTYNVCAAILSLLIDSIECLDDRIRLIDKIIKKFSHIPNTGIMEIWLQRIVISQSMEYDFRESLCKLVQGEHPEIWENKWIKDANLKKAININSIIDTGKLEECKMKPRIGSEEFDIFSY
jgi:hypothetical protein